ncbi:MAG: hypothetical protein MRJ93_05145 [Nitrososphaeraceae archaeon]|nr:hypothetical protein [Nitrososphaeraceae archaeon]
MNTKTKTFSMFLLAAVLVTGTISMTIPSSFAAPVYYSYDDSYANDYKKKGTNVNIQKAKCTNIIINGVDKSRPTPGEDPYAMAADENDGMSQQGQWINNAEKKFKGTNGNIVNICLNKNNIIAVGDDQKDTGQTCTVKTLTKTQINNINKVLKDAADAMNPITFQVGEDTPQPVRMLFALCDIVNNAGGQVTRANIESFFEEVNTELPEADQIPQEVIDELILCLQDAGLAEARSE